MTGRRKVSSQEVQGGTQIFLARRDMAGRGEVSNQEGCDRKQESFFTGGTGQDADFLTRRAGSDTENFLTRKDVTGRRKVSSQEVQGRTQKGF